MNAPDTIYIHPESARWNDRQMETYISRPYYLEHERKDSFVAYVPAEISYDLAKIVEAQAKQLADLSLLHNGVVFDLRAAWEALVEARKTIEAQKAEIARLQKALEDHGRHALICESLEHAYQPCTCGFTAALKGE